MPHQPACYFSPNYTCPQLHGQHIPNTGRLLSAQDMERTHHAGDSNSQPTNPPSSIVACNSHTCHLQFQPWHRINRGAQIPSPTTRENNKAVSERQTNDNDKIRKGLTATPVNRFCLSGELGSLRASISRVERIERCSQMYRTISPVLHESHTELVHIIRRVSDSLLATGSSWTRTRSAGSRVLTGSNSFVRSTLIHGLSKQRRQNIND